MNIEKIRKQIYEFKINNNKTSKIYKIVSDFINSGYSIINNKTISNFKKQNSSTFTNEEIFKKLIIDLFVSSMPNDRKLIEDYVNKYVKKVDIKSYYQNPYYTNVKVRNIKYNNWYLKYDEYKAYQGFICGNTLKDEQYNSYPSLCYFDKDFEYISVYENNEEWMAIEPNEIETMKEPIAKATGNVLTIGLGLGYYAYMVSLKEDVTQIDIVEKDPNIIKLFKDVILPQFKNKNKINIICCDAFEYIEKMETEKYDYIFIDIWKNANDGLNEYLDFKRNLKRIDKIKIDYWIENEILNYMRFIIINLLYELYCGLKPDELQTDEEQIDKLYKKVYQVISNKEINDLYDFISDENLKNII